jgi:hypothetical protein
VSFFSSHRVPSDWGLVLLSDHFLLNLIPIPLIDLDVQAQPALRSRQERPPIGLNQPSTSKSEYLSDTCSRSLASDLQDDSEER